MFSHGNRSDMTHGPQSHPAVSVKSVPMKHSTGKINAFAHLGWCLEEKKKHQMWVTEARDFPEGFTVGYMVTVLYLRQRTHTQGTLCQ